MKRKLALILAACFMLTLALCACGGNDQPAATNPPATNPPATDAPTNPPADPTDNAPADPTDPPAEPTDPPAGEDPFEIAKSLIDHDVSELYDAIGEPISAEYSPGCTGPQGSEDGELIYDGFVVFTVRTDTEEYVYDVDVAE